MMVWNFQSRTSTKANPRGANPKFGFSAEFPNKCVDSSLELKLINWSVEVELGFWARLEQQLSQAMLGLGSTNSQAKLDVSPAKLSQANLQASSPFLKPCDASSLA